MLTATRYFSCSLVNGRLYISQIGTPSASVPSYRTQEEVAQQMDQRLDRVVHTVAELETLQQESVSRALPFRLVFVADSLEDEVRRRSKVR